MFTACSQLPRTAVSSAAGTSCAARQVALGTVTGGPNACFSTSTRWSNAAAPASKTVLHDFHVQQGGKMVTFGGYSMPLSYASLGQVASHHHTRNAASLFDVSHMVQHYFRGPGAAAFLEWLTPSSLSKLPDHQGTLSLLLNFGGGILDDLVITKINQDTFYVVTNAGCREGDLKWIAERLQDWRKDGKPQVEHTVLDGQGLVALQGPKSAEVLSKHTDADLSKLTFGKSVYATVAGAQGCHIARGGYTGEDGFEISIPQEKTVEVTRTLLETSPAAMAGLAARDSLRLEAGMCLYGHDLDPTVGPAEGALTWVVAKDRREQGDFVGAERVLREIKEGPRRRRVGLIVEGAPARGEYGRADSMSSRATKPSNSLYCLI